MTLTAKLAIIGIVFFGSLIGAVIGLTAETPAEQPHVEIY